MTNISNIKHSLRFSHFEHMYIMQSLCSWQIRRGQRPRPWSLPCQLFYILLSAIVRLIPRYYCLAHCTTVPSKPKVSILIPHLVICKHIWNKGQPPFTLQNQKSPWSKDGFLLSTSFLSCTLVKGCSFHSPWSKVGLYSLSKGSPCQRSKVGLLASVWAELDPCVVRGRLGLQDGDDDCEADGDNEMEI